ncbi:BatA and WFA domain-containing protein, partial [Elusimicrobiota bacterium]
PLFLLFSVLAAVPVIIHFFNRSRLKRIPFPTLKFLQPATKKLLKRFKLLHLLLLILRVLIVVILSMAFARPLWRGYKQSPKGQMTVILIDNSYSMSYRMSNQTALEVSKELARKITGHINGQVAVGVINEKLRILHPFSVNKDEISRKIDSVSQSAYSTNINSALYELMNRLDSNIETETMRNIIIFSDFNKDSFKEKFESGYFRDNRLLFIDTASGRNNIWLEDMNIRTVYEDMPVLIKADVGSTHACEVKASLFISGNKINQKSIELIKGSSLEFRHMFSNPGYYPVRIQIESAGSDDMLELDNVYYSAIDVRPRIAVLIVDGSPGYTLMAGESYFLAKAVSPGSYRTPIYARVVDPRELDRVDTDRYAVLLLLNVKLDAGIINSIWKFSDQGKGIGVFAGENIDQKTYNRMLSTLIPIRILSAQPEHPDKKFALKISGRFKDIFSQSPEIRIGSYYRTAANTSLKPVITAADDPLLWFYTPDKIVKRKVAFCSTTADMSWNDFPLKTTYPAFIQELIIGLADTDNTEKGSYVVGQIISGMDSASSDIKVITSEEFGIADIVRQSDLNQAEYPGHYSWVDSGRIESVNLNLQSNESELNNLGREEIKDIFKTADIDYVPFSQNMYKDILRILKGHEKSSLFLFMVLIFLIIEESLRKYLHYHDER